MLSVRRVSVVLAVVAGLVWAISSWGGSQALPQLDTQDASGTSVQDGSHVAPADANETSLAARYHLRKRTSNFYKRATRDYRGGVKFVPRYRSRYRRIGAVEAHQDSQLLAARYHLRKRTSGFFKRATSRYYGGGVKIKAGHSHGRHVGAVESHEDSQLLAARYHLRGRTTRFFRRATA